MKLKHANTILLVIIVAVNCVTLLLPVWPAAAFRLENRMTDRKAELSHQIENGSTEETRPDSLVIPAMLFDQPIHEGATEKTLNQGLWLKPNASTPDQGSNTVIVAHRFTYKNPKGTFYHLDKVHAGDQLAVWWQGKKYVYTVSEAKTVPASATEVEAPTAIPTLTLYTCTPLWNPKENRLVVTAVLEQEL